MSDETKKKVPWAEIKAAANEIADLLGETHAVPRAQIRHVVEACGIEFARGLYQETQQIEADGGLMLPDQSRRRTVGGVFFHLARKKLAPELVKKIFPGYKRKQKPKQQKASSAPVQTVVVEELPVFVWDERAGLVEMLAAEQGVVSSMKVTLIGRPGKIEARKDVIITTMLHTIQSPMLPKGVPMPPSDPMLYTVYISAKQWRKIEAAIADPADSLIVEGLCTYDPAIKGMAVFATNALSKSMEIKRRDGQKAASQSNPAPATEETEAPAAVSTPPPAQAPPLPKPKKSRIAESLPVVEPAPTVVPSIPGLPADVAQKLQELYASASLFRQKVATIQSKPAGQQFGLEMTQKLLKNVEDEIAALEKKYAE